jgi:hypothetical protein
VLGLLNQEGITMSTQFWMTIDGEERFLAFGNKKGDVIGKVKYNDDVHFLYKKLTNEINTLKGSYADNTTKHYVKEIVQKFIDCLFEQRHLGKRLSVKVDYDRLFAPHEFHIFFIERKLNG